MAKVELVTVGTLRTDRQKLKEFAARHDVNVYDVVSALVELMDEDPNYVLCKIRKK